MSSDKGIITTSSLSSSSSRSASPSSSSSPSTNYPPSPPAAVTSPPPSSSSSSSPDSPPPDLPPAAVTSLPSSSHSAVLPEVAAVAAVAVVMINSCVACKYLGWSCEGNCVLATCFAPNDLLKFSAVHRIFGASNIVKVLQELPEHQRADAVSSMVYEANTRLRDPVYGCAGAICQLQMQVNVLQAQLVKAQAEIVNMQCQQANPVALVCTEMGQSPQALPRQSLDNFTDIGMSFLDDFNNFGSLGEPLWT